MTFIALKRLFNRAWLTLLSIVGVALAVALVTSVPIFSQAVSYVMLDEELRDISSKTGRPLFSIRVYALPSAKYALYMDQCRVIGGHIQDALGTEVGLPVVSQYRHVETTGMVLRTRDELTAYGEPHTFLNETKLAVLPGAESRLTIVDGEPMRTDNSVSPGQEENGLDVWLHYTAADEMGITVGEEFEVRDLRRGVSIPIRIAGIWRASNPKDQFWFSSPDMSLRRVLLTREADYEALAEPSLEGQLGFASWYVTMDDSKIVPERMGEYAAGLNASFKIVSKFLPNSRADFSPADALNRAITRETDLTVLLFAFSVPVMAFLLYFLSLISTITIRWQRRETAVMVSRGLRSNQLLIVGLIEAVLIMGVGCVLGGVLGIELAQLMGYTESFMSFTVRESLPITPTAINVPLVIAALGATLLARLWPLMRSTRTGVIAHERTRARAPQKPFWQRFYLDFALLVPVIYAYQQLQNKGTLIPEALAGENSTGQDPLLFLVPSLFMLACSLLLVRLFPILMRIGDWLGSQGRQTTLYLAFRQLARQSGQYTSALLLVITSLSLGGFMASMAGSLDEWMIDQVYYHVGSDILLKQTTNPDEEEPAPPTEGAWVLPVDSYLEVPGVVDAARVGMYPAFMSLSTGRTMRSTFMGVDRLDLPRLVFFRRDFNSIPLGAMMNQLAQREDAVLVSEKALERSGYEVGDKVSVSISIADLTLKTEFTIAGTYKYFPTVYEEGEGRGRGYPAIIGNLDFLFEQIGGTLIHNVWLKIEPDADNVVMKTAVEDMGVFISRWLDSREVIAEEQAKVERVGIFGTLTIGFLAAAVLSGIGLLVYNYASLQERLFRFTILRAVGLSLIQVVGQVAIEYLVLMVYSVAGGATIGVVASRIFIPFFQAADQNVINPPTLIPLIAYQDIGQISAVFTMVLVVAQIVVIRAALRGGVFQALRMGDRE